MEMEAYGRLFGVELVEPVFHVAEGAQEAEAGLGEVEGGVEGVLKFLALVDAGELFCFWAELGLGTATRGGSVAEVELGEDGLELFGRDLLFEASDFGLGVEFAKVACERCDLDVVLIPSLFGFSFGAKGVGGGLPGDIVACKVEERKLELQTEADVIGSEVLVVGGVAVEFVGVVVVDGSESYLKMVGSELVAVCFDLLGLGESGS